MNKSVFYKEWIKTRWYVFAFVLLGLALEGVMFLKLNKSFRFAGHEHLWSVIVNKHQFMFSHLKYFPLAAGLVLGMAQNLPEIISSRIKLSLHLPMKETKVTTLMVLYGLWALLGTYLILFIFLITGAGIYFPIEMVTDVAITVLPWFVSGITGYFLLAFTLYEPTWKRRVLNLLLSFFILSSFYMGNLPQAYKQALWYIILVPILGYVCVYYSVYRFKIGVQAS